jgi:hypothetical protein
MIFQNKYKFVIISIYFCCTFFFFEGEIVAAGIRTSPPILFYNSSQKSEHCSAFNPSDKTVEVWVDFKYGYTIINDSGKPEVVMPETLKEDDRSAAGWLKAYPQRFTLGPQESQILRIVATPPPGTPPGEYWSRILFSSKDERLPGAAAKGIQSAIGIISITSVPFHYRVQSPTTGFQLKRPIEYANKDTNLMVTLPLARTGNASYWGQVTLELYNLAGKKVFTDVYKLAIYKDIDYTIRINKSALLPGEYTLKLVARTERTDVTPAKIIKSDPITWTLPVKIQ